MMNPRVLAVVARQMEEWVEANRAVQPDPVIEAVAFWARQLRREIPAAGPPSTSDSACSKTPRPA